MTDSRTLCLVYGQLAQIGPRIIDQLALLGDLGIPADVSVRLDHSADEAAAVRRWAAAGNVISPGLYPPMLDPACPSQNWWRYDRDTCRRLLRLAKAKARDAGLGELDAIDAYTPGNGLIAACKDEGIHFLTGFCGPTVANDGHWQLCHVGAPLTPFFASAEDYRKPELPVDDRWTMICNMELRSPLTCLENWNEGPFCPLNLAMGDRTIEPGELPVETLAACEDWLRMSELTAAPRILIVNLQYFTSRRCYDLNRRLLEWLVGQRERNRLRFTGLRELAGIQRAAGGLLPQTTWWRGENMGMHCGGQAGDGNPCIVHEDREGQRVWRQGDAGPERAFDYRQRWDYPAFEPLGLLPASHGHAASVELVSRTVLPDRVRLELRWNAQASGPVQLCAWGALDGLRPPFAVLTGVLPCSPVPHPSGVGGAVLLRCPMPTGSASIEISHAGAGEPRSSRRWAGLVAVETVWLDHRPVTRLAALVPDRVNFNLRIPGTQSVRWESLVGGRSLSGLLHPGDTLPVELDGRRSASLLRLWDVSAADLPEPAELAGEHARLLAAAQALGPADAPLAFGPEARQPAWLAAAVRTAADREIARIDAVRQSLAPGAALAWRHMAIDLPFGSATRVRSENRHDRSGGNGGEFFPIYYDYGQAWAPGVAGWNQFWQIDLGLRGFTSGRPLRLVLHAWDPEARGSQLRIFARACDAHAEVQHGPVFDLSATRHTAQGLDARCDPAAFWILDLPAALCTGPAIQVTLRGDSERVRYDRLAEGFGFVCLSHAWLLPGAPTA